MGDIYCAKCEEPWDAYGVRNGDMEPEEARRFLRGQGCPCCDFGTKCTSCYGTGKESGHGYGQCQTCMGMRKVLARRLVRMRGWGSGHWDYGYIPNVKQVNPEAKPIGKPSGLKESRDGLFEEQWFHCWACQADPCGVCGGSGKFTPRGDPEEIALRAAESHVSESDEEPIGLLIDRGLL